MKSLDWTRFMRFLTPLLVREFWLRVDRQGDRDCWQWLGHLREGYGVFSVGRCQHGAHRVAYVIANRCTIPAGMVIRHTCDNPACVNPAHLLIGTVADNNRDIVARGRTRIGRRPRSRPPLQKLPRRIIESPRCLSRS